MPASDLSGGEASVGGLVERAVGRERRHEGGEGAAEAGGAVVRGTGGGGSSRVSSSGSCWAVRGCAVRRGWRPAWRRAGRRQRRRTGGGRAPAARETSQRAAATAPSAYAVRSRAVSRSSTDSPGPSNVTRCVPGAAPARIPATSSAGRASVGLVAAGPARVGRDDPAGDRPRGARRPIGLAAPVPLDDRRLEPSGASRTIAAAPSTRRRNSAAPSARFGATTAAASRSSSRARTRREVRLPGARRENERAVAGRRARGPGCRPPRRPSTPRRRHRPPARARGRRRAPAARARSAVQPRSRRGMRDCAAQASRPVDEEVHSDHPFRGVSRGSGGPKNHKGRGTVVVSAAPSSPPVPEAPWFVARAPSEPQGPSLPAGPPRLLLGVEADEVGCDMARAVCRISREACNHLSVERCRPHERSWRPSWTGPWGPPDRDRSGAASSGRDARRPSEAFEAGLARRRASAARWTSRPPR